MKLKNSFIHAILRIHHFFHPKKNVTLDQEAPRILIVSTTGLGDTLWGTPAIRALKKTFPKSFIAVLTSPIGSAVLAKNPHIDEMFVLKDPILLGAIKLAKTLRKRKFEKVIVFHLSQRPILPLAAMTGASEIIGSEGINKGLDFILTGKTPKLDQHEIERRLDLVKQMGATLHGPEMEMFASDASEVNFFFDDNRPIVGLHPGSKDGFKRWRKEHFIAVGKHLSNDGKVRIVVTGSKDEQKDAEMIADQIPGALSLAGQLSLSGLTALMERLSVFITNDTGPMHIAFAKKTKTIALFGPTDPKKCGPYHVENAHFFRAKPTCSPCLKRKCAEPFCLDQIGVSEMIDVAQEALKNALDH